MASRLTGNRMEGWAARAVDGGRPAQDERKRPSRWRHRRWTRASAAGGKCFHCLAMTNEDGQAALADLPWAMGGIVNVAVEGGRHPRLRLLFDGRGLPGCVGREGAGRKRGMVQQRLVDGGVNGGVS